MRLAVKWKTLYFKGAEKGQNTVGFEHSDKFGPLAALEIIFLSRLLKIDNHLEKKFNRIDCFISNIFFEFRINLHVLKDAYPFVDEIKSAFEIKKILEHKKPIQTSAKNLVENQKSKTNINPISNQVYKKDKSGSMDDRDHEKATHPQFDSVLSNLNEIVSRTAFLPLAKTTTKNTSEYFSFSHYLNESKLNHHFQLGPFQKFNVNQEDDFGNALSETNNSEFLR